MVRETLSAEENEEIVQESFNHVERLARVETIGELSPSQ